MLCIKKVIDLTPRMALWIIFSTILLLVGGCKGCTPEQIAENLDNGNDDHEILIIETWGTEVRNALSSSAASVSRGFGYDCLGSSNFVARVNIEVRTASLVNGQIIVDPTPYFDDIFLNVSFFNNTGFNDGTQIEISVPETGGYALFYEVELSQCSICCHGTSDKQCGDDKSNGECEAGLPRLQYERVFTTENRPPPNFNFELETSGFVVRQCICGCDVDC